jgi:uncharacterized membrane protein YoaK (UPF0700 family)
MRSVLTKHQGLHPCRRAVVMASRTNDSPGTRGATYDVEAAALPRGTPMSRRIKPRDITLMSLTVSSGVVDAISFIAFGKVFTAFMTGNLVFLGLGMANAFKPGGPNLVRVAVVLAAFAVGVFLAARVIKRVRHARGDAAGLPFALTGVLVAQIVFFVGWVAVSGDPSDTYATCLAALEAIAMGMQSSAVGSLDVKGVFTTAATATLINLSREAADRETSTTDPAQLARILVCLIAGATIGGLLLVNARMVAPLVSPLATTLAIAASLPDLRAGRRGAAATSAKMSVADHGRQPAPGDPAPAYREAA